MPNSTISAVSNKNRKKHKDPVSDTSTLQRSAFEPTISAYPKKGQTLGKIELTEEEQEHLQNVIKRFDDARQLEETRLKKLRNRLVQEQKERIKKIVVEEGVCSNCGSRFVSLLNPSLNCMRCNKLMCRRCLRNIPGDISEVCRFCHMETLHRCQTGVWFNEQLKHARQLGRVRAVCGPDALRSSIIRYKHESASALGIDMNYSKEAHGNTTTLGAAVKAEDGKLDIDQITSGADSAIVESTFDIKSREAILLARRQSTRPKESREDEFDDPVGAPGGPSSSADARSRPLRSPSPYDNGGAVSGTGTLPNYGGTLRVAPGSPRSRLAGSATNIYGASSLAPGSPGLAGKILRRRLDSNDTGSMLSLPSQQECLKVNQSIEQALSLRDQMKAELDYFLNKRSSSTPSLVPWIRNNQINKNTNISRLETINNQKNISVTFQLENTSLNNDNEGLQFESSDEASSAAIHVDNSKALQPRHKVLATSLGSLCRRVTLKRQSSRKSAMSHAGSMMSMYSDVEESYHHGMVITGELNFALDYDSKGCVLRVYLKQAKDITIADKKRNTSDPYVKAYLLPDKTKASKRRSSQKKASLNPVFEEEFRYRIQQPDLMSRSLQLSIWHHQSVGGNIFLGQVTINLDEHHFDPAPCWYPLREMKKMALPAQLLLNRGEVLMSVKFLPIAGGVKRATGGNGSDVDSVVSTRSRVRLGPDAVGELHIWLKHAKGLTTSASSAPKLGSADASGKSINSYAKVYLLPDKPKDSKRKTKVYKHTSNPAWNTVLVYSDLRFSDLANHGIELSVWDQGKMAANDFLGGARLNLGTKSADWMDANKSEQAIWRAMMERPNTWIEGTIHLRANLD